MSEFDLMLSYIVAERDKELFWTEDYFMNHELVPLLALATAVLVMGCLFVMIVNAYLDRDAPVPRRLWLLPVAMAVIAFVASLGADWLDVCLTYSDLRSQMAEGGLLR